MTRESDANWYARVESADLWIADSSGVVWHGQPDDAPARLAIALPATDDAIVLLDPDSAPRNAYGGLTCFQNLIRVTTDGQVGWRAGAVEDKDICPECS